MVFKTSLTLSFAVAIASDGTDVLSGPSGSGKVFLFEQDPLSTHLKYFKIDITQINFSHY